jgi:pyruvate kinase
MIAETDYIPAMKRAAAIVAEEGGLLSHAAIVARELGKPSAVGVSNALALLVNHEIGFIASVLLIAGRA